MLLLTTTIMPWSATHTAAFTGAIVDLFNDLKPILLIVLAIFIGLEVILVLIHHLRGKRE